MHMRCECASARQAVVQLGVTLVPRITFLLESGGARRPCLMAKCFKQLVPSQDSSLEDDDLLDLTFVYVINMKNLLDMNVCILPYRAASGYHREGVRRGAFL